MCAAKSVIDIDVQDQKFSRFNELFGKYQQQLAKTPGLWKDATKESAALSSQFERMAAALLAQGHAAKENDEEEKKRLDRLKHTESLWTSIGKSSGALAKNVLDVGSGLLKWGSLIAGGVLGGSLFGVDRIGAAAADQRRSASGLGLSVGERSAFSTNFRRFIDPDAYLSGISNAASDVSKQGPLYGIGVNPNQGTADVAVDTLKAVRALVQGTPVNQLGVLGSSRHLDQLGFSVEDLRRLRSSSNGEFNSQVSHFKSDVGALGFGDNTGRVWQNFTDQMSRAGQTIFKTFVEGLEPVAAPLARLSEAVVHVIERFAHGGAIATAVDDLAKYLDRFTGTIGKPEFLQKVEAFASDVGTLGDAIHTVAETVAHPGDAAVNFVKKDIQAGAARLASPFTWAYGALDKWSAHEKINTWEQRLGLPKGIGDFIWGKASGQSLDETGALDQPGKDGAQGPFQIKRSQGGGADLHHFNTSLPQAMKILAEEIRHYHGDVLKGIAASHLGDATLDKIIANAAKSGADWRSAVPYIQGIKIENATGGNAIVSASQLTQ